MTRRLASRLGFALLALRAGSSFAVDSYRYMHVTIETPWMIFLFLLVAVFVPFILMLVLMWRRRPGQKPTDESDAATPAQKSQR
jgi:uncharacterized membrane protein AbrB (regulator of aidB expression)